MSPERVVVGQAEDVPPGTMRIYAFEGTPVLVVNLDGRFTAVQTTCTHEAEPLIDGYLTGSTLVCAYHGSEFDLVTGEAIGPPAEDPLTVYGVTVVGADICLTADPERGPA